MVDRRTRSTAVRRPFPPRCAPAAFRSRAAALETDRRDHPFDVGRSVQRNRSPRGWMTSLGAAIRRWPRRRRRRSSLPVRHETEALVIRRAAGTGRRAAGCLPGTPARRRSARTSARPFSPPRISSAQCRARGRRRPSGASRGYRSCTRANTSMTVAMFLTGRKFDACMITNSPFPRRTALRSLLDSRGAGTDPSR